MTNGIPKPPPGFQLIESGNIPPPPPGFVVQQSAPPPIPDPMGQEFLREQPGMPRRVARSVAEGATFGFSDEMKAGISALMDAGLSYEQALEIERARMARIPTAERIAGNVVGGMVTAPAMGLRAPASVAQAARQGAGMGTIAGAGFAEGGPVERVAGAAGGAALGAPLAAGGQALMGAIGRAIARARQGVDRQTAKAMDQVLQEMRAGEITPDQAINRVQRLGPEGIFADVPELQRLAQQTAARTTTGGRIASSALEARRAKAGTRVNEALDLALGGRNTREVRNAIVQTRKAEAQNLYKQALSGGPLDLTDDLAGLIGRPGKKGIEGGSSLVRGQLESIRRSNPKFRNAPDTDPELLHAVRVALSDRSKGQGAAKRNINDIVQQLTDAMDAAGAKGYRQAVDQYRTDSLTLEAFDKGRKALNALPEDIAAFMKNAPDAEQDAFVAGMGREILRNLETGETRAATTGVRNVFRGERAQVLRETLGPEGYNALRNRLMREIRFAETGQRVLGGSPTQPRQAAGLEQMRRLGRMERATEAIRRGPGTLASAGAELLASAQPTAPNIGRERALAQLLFRSQGQGLPAQRFAAEMPMQELAMRDALIRALRMPRAPIPGAAGVAGGSAIDPLLNQAGF